MGLSPEECVMTWLLVSLIERANGRQMTGAEACEFIKLHGENLHQTVKLLSPMVQGLARPVPVAGSPRVSFPGEAGIGDKSAK